MCRWKIIGNPIGTFSIRLAKEPVFRIVDRLKEIPANINAESEKSIPAIAEIPTEQHRFDNRFEFKEERSVLSFPEFLLLALDIFKNRVENGPFIGSTN